MRYLGDIIVGNLQWEAREHERIQREHRARTKRQEIEESKLLPRLRSLWGPGPTDIAILMWYRASDSVTKELVQ